MSFYRTQGILAAGLGLLTIACSDPELNTTLVSEGPPQTLTVTVLSEAAGDEVATFCTSDKASRVNERYCARDRETDDIIAVDPVSDTVPQSWFARVVFDELLDPDVEQLIVADDGSTSGSLAQTQPVTVTCGTTALAYDGYYDPSGSRDTVPPGPSLVIEIDGFLAATSSACTLALKDVITDKDGNQVPTTERGPFAFDIAVLDAARGEAGVLGGEPADCADGIDPASTIEIPFNAPINPDTIGENFVLTDAAGAVVAATVALKADDPTTPDDDESDDTIVVITPTAPLANATKYTITVTSTGDTKIADTLGGAADFAAPATSSFTTAEAEGQPTPPATCPE
jgi:Big-like domain-containing protein